MKESFCWDVLLNSIEQMEEQQSMELDTFRDNMKRIHAWTDYITEHTFLSVALYIELKLFL